jgi:Protein of unknown function (DUF1761)
MSGVNVWAVLGAGVSAFLLGGFWYSPVLFGAAWQRAAGLPAEHRPGDPVLVFGGSAVLSIIAAFVFALFLGPSPSLKLAVGAGAAAGLCWVTASFGINYLFEHRKLALFLINGGYHTLQFTLYGLVLGLWH